MARPKSDDPRTELLATRVTPGEKARIAERAAAAGMKVGEFIRRRALGEKPRGLTPIAAPSPSPRAPVNPTVLAARLEEVAVPREIEEAMLDDPTARDTFITRRTLQLRGEGKTTPVARKAAEEEWATR
jgi:hypothetical protein